MRNSAFGLAAVAAVLLSIAPAAVSAQSPAAQSAPVAAADKPYFDLYDAMLSGFDMVQLADAGSDAIFDSLVRNQPQFADLARTQPGLKERFRTMARPYLKVWMERGFVSRRGAFVEKAKPIVTPAEAGEIAAFFSSPLGKKMMGSVASNLTLDDTLDKTIRTGDYKGISEKDESRMVQGAVGDLFANMTKEEQAEATRLSSRPAFRKLPQLTNVLKSIPEPEFDQISTAQERESFAKAAQAFLAEANSRN